MSGLVQDKVALVTGAGSGIGRVAALLFAREGARVVVSDRQPQTGEETAEAIRAAGGEVDFVVADVSREDQVEALVERAVDRFGRLDCAFNNAGITGSPTPLHQLSTDHWQQILAVNLTGVFLCMKYELERMQAQGSGAIVNCASGSGVVATPGLAAYCATKHGVLGLTKTAAVENAKTGVRVNAVCPGSTDTPALRAVMAIDPSVEQMVLRSVPSGRLGEASEIAEAAVWLCSDRASFVSGHSLFVDGASVAR
jgi:NAD(P)-dependent dehydrogenase (short-subunit alcohol dehydrogenase family)